MKKITFTLLIAVLLVLLAACGPNYTEEYNAVVDAYNADIEKSDAAAEAFDAGIGDLTDAEAFFEECEEMKAVDEEILANTKAYLEEIKGYEEGISDKESYQETVSNMEDTIVTLEAELVAIPQLIEYYNLSMEFSDLSDEWGTAITEKYDELADAEDTETLNSGIDAAIALNNDYSKQMQDIVTKLEAIDSEEFAADIMDTISFIEGTISSIAEETEDFEALKQ